MAEVIWAEPALNDLDAIADYIALDNPTAASELVQRILRHVDQLILHRDSGAKPRELRGGRYRQVVEPPCRIFYRREGETDYVVYVMRGERKLRPPTWQRVAKSLRHRPANSSAAKPSFASPWARRAATGHQETFQRLKCLTHSGP